MDFLFVDRDSNAQNEYILSKSKPTNLHLARMPENFRMTLPKDHFEDSTKINRTLQVRKQWMNEENPMEGSKYIMEDHDELKKNDNGSNQPTRYIGKETVQKQKTLVFYRKEKEIMFCKLSSTISFKKEQQLKSSATESISGKGRGRQQGIKALLRTSAKKREEKEKDSDDCKLSSKSWSDSDSDAGYENGTRAEGKQNFSMRDIFEQEIPQSKASPASVKKTNESKSTRTPTEKELSAQGTQKDSDGDSDSSFDFD